MTIRAVLTLLVVTAIAHAQPAGAQAEALFRQGRELMAQGKLAEACSAFEESQKLDPAVTTLLNLASCREQRGQLASAWGLFLEAERETRPATDAAAKKLHDVAQDHASKLEPRLSKLTIAVATPVDGLEVTRDKDAQAPVTWNRALPIDGGTYTITAKAPGTATWSTHVTVAPERDAKTVEVPDVRTLPRDVVAEPARPVATPTAPTAPRGRLPLYLVGASALVLGGGAVGFSLWGDRTYQAAKDELTDQARRDRLYDAANTKLYIAQGLAIGGVACVGVGLWLYLSGRHAEKRTASRVVVSPTGIAWLGHF